MPRLKAPQRREQLIAVATKVFARFGYDATTTAAIADAAGVTEPILYRHFGSKQELFIAITRAVSEQAIQEWHNLIANIDDPGDQLRAISRQYPERLRQIGDMYRVIHNALTTSRDRKVQAVLREHYRRMEEFFTGIIVAGQKKGIFRAGDPHTPCWQLMNTGLGYTILTLNLGQIETFDVEEAMDFIIRGLKA